MCEVMFAKTGAQRDDFNFKNVISPLMSSNIPVWGFYISQLNMLGGISNLEVSFTKMMSDAMSYFDLYYIHVFPCLFSQHLAWLCICL